MNNKNDTVMILDDEPQHQQWLVEFIESKNYRVESAMNLEQAEALLRQNKYRFVVIDLNVPAQGSSARVLMNEGALARRYPGIVAAQLARNLGYRNRQVVLYSVHNSDEVRKEAARIGVRYILKGRPKEFKEEVESILQRDPSSSRVPTSSSTRI